METVTQKQALVTWRNAAIRVGEDLCSVGPFGYYDMTAEQWLDWALSVVTVHASPPQRQPLTDEELFECEQLAHIKHRRHMSSVRGQQISPADDFLWHYARVLEAAHGIK
jgi:hypothetical protein